jgi:hypothetical protein
MLMLDYFNSNKMVKSKITLLLFMGLLLIQVTVVLAQEPHREATPTVVNPVLRSSFRQTMSLDGKWDFAIDPTGVGETQKWYEPNVLLPNKIRIQVPGCWEAQGIGGRGPNLPLHPPEQANRTLIGSYVGTAWYKKYVTIPEQWQGKEIWLKVGGVNAQGWFWANGAYLGHLNSYCGTYKYRVTDLVDANGDLVITAKVRNDVPSGKGLLNYVHRFGGLYRSVELDATPSVLVDYAYIQGDFDAQSAEIHVKLRSTDTQQVQVDLEATIKMLNNKQAGQASTVVEIEPGQIKEVILNTRLNPFNAWSPEKPNLYRIDIVLKRNGEAVDGWVERFGLRKWEARGGDFYLNNRRHLVRGYGDDAIYPLTIASPASRNTHRQNLLTAKQFGFNYVRHHTHCEIPEFYEAADEVGIMVQPELPYWGPKNSWTGSWGPEWFRPKEDLQELVTHYRRHVSLSTYCTGNEGHLGSPIDEGIYDLAKKVDPTRLFLHQDGGHNTPENSDFGTGPFNIWHPGKGPSATRPWFAHEYLNLAVDPDPRLAPKYNAAQLPPIPPDIYKAQLETADLNIRWRNDILDSGYYLQRLWQKLGLESARLDPACDGYIYWTLLDVNCYADQGLLDQFWCVKKTTPEFLYQSNGPTVVLAANEQQPIGADQRILAEGDTLEVDWWISHFGELPLDQVTLTWSIEVDKLALGSGNIKDINVTIGEVKQVGKTSFKVPKIKIPVRANLVAKIEGTTIENSWELWLFPKLVPQVSSGEGLAASARVYNVIVSRYPELALLGEPEAENTEVIITDQIDGPILDALANGRKVLLLSLDGPEPGLIVGWWIPGFAYHKPVGFEDHAAFQTGSAIADHPAFGDFPHDGYLNYLFFRLLKNTVKCSDQKYHGVEKLMVSHGMSPYGYLAHIFQAKVGKGKILACGLDVLSQNVESAYLLDQFIRYICSPQFLPEGEFNIDAALKLFELTGDCNGWSETVLQHHRIKYDSFLGPLTIDIARFSQGQTEVAWLTQPIPKDLDPQGFFTFKWISALGWISEPAHEFELMLGDKKLLTFGIAHDKNTWESDDDKVTLKYTPYGRMTQGQDSSGIMELTLPTDMLKPAKKALLRVVAPQSGSRRWFGLYHFPSD